MEIWGGGASVGYHQMKSFVIKKGCAYEYPPRTCDTLFFQLHQHHLAPPQHTHRVHVKHATKMPRETSTSHRRHHDNILSSSLARSTPSRKTERDVYQLVCP